MKNNNPILYSYLDCPYCMRARSALVYANIPFILREVDLRAKPAELLEASPKGSVPVLVLPDNRVVDQSLDIMFWALEQSDPEQWLPSRIEDLADAKEIIHLSDLQFAPILRKYKNLTLNTDFTREQHKAQAVEFLLNMEALLEGNDYLQGNNKTIADIGIMPFVRLFSLLEPDWSNNNQLINTQSWLQRLVATKIFVKIMQPYPIWTKNSTEIIIK